MLASTQDYCKVCIDIQSTKHMAIYDYISSTLKIDFGDTRPQLTLNWHQLFNTTKHPIRTKLHLIHSKRHLINPRHNVRVNTKLHLISIGYISSYRLYLILTELDTINIKLHLVNTGIHPILIRIYFILTMLHRTGTEVHLIHTKPHFIHSRPLHQHKASSHPHKATFHPLEHLSSALENNSTLGQISSPRGPSHPH
jgi:hypothetical protein